MFAIITKNIGKIISNNGLKESDIKNCTYYCFDDTININDFSAENIKVDHKSCKNIFIYYLDMKQYTVRKRLYI